MGTFHSDKNCPHWDNKNHKNRQGYWPGRLRRAYERQSYQNQDGRWFQRFIPIGWYCPHCGYIEYD